MIPNGRQLISSTDIKAVVRVLKSDWLTQGPKVSEFEKALAKYCGAKYAVAVSSGTAALHLAYLAAGFKKGDEIITSPNTFAATVNMILACGARPVFCDIRKDTYNLDETKIEKLISKKTKAIIPVHFAGQPCEMGKILKIARKHHLLVIEDACHALGASYHGKRIGGFPSDLTVFSFHPVKSITTGEGGAILTNNKKLYQKILLLRSHGIVKDKNGFNVMQELGYNYRLTDLQAALGLSQLKQLKAFIAKRHKLFAVYQQELSRVSEIILPNELSMVKSSHHLMVIRVKKLQERLPLYLFLKKNKIGVNFHYPLVYHHPYYRRSGLIKSNCPVAEQYEKTAITLPLFPSLQKKQIKYIADKIELFYKNYYG